MVLGYPSEWNWHQPSCSKIWPFVSKEHPDLQGYPSRTTESRLHDLCLLTLQLTLEKKNPQPLVVFTIPDRESSESLDSMAPIVSLLSFLLKRKAQNSRCLFDKMMLHLQHLDPKHLMLSDQWHFYLGHEMIFGREKREFLESPLPVHCKTRPLNPHTDLTRNLPRFCCHCL